MKHLFTALAAGQSPSPCRTPVNPPRHPGLRVAGLALALAGLLGAAGCTTVKNIGSSVSTLGGLITPYKIDILQGNVVTAEQVQALQPGMPRDQVRNILGTPLLTSAFHADRWDYVFTFQRQGQEPQQRRVVVFFNGDTMARVEADELPTEEEFVATLDDRRKPTKPPVLQATEEQLRAFEERNRRATPAPASSTTAASAAPAPATSYPPLEPR
jgi:outer membrane protein assembly factor BamE